VIFLRTHTNILNVYLRELAVDDELEAMTVVVVVVVVVAFADTDDEQG
jgi:hypothetical protein